jgi:hypothetical protein
MSRWIREGQSTADTGPLFHGNAANLIKEQNAFDRLVKKKNS